MKREKINRHFQQLMNQRDVFYDNSSLNFNTPWKRPLPNKWSIGETLYHLFLMIKLFRRFSRVYIPIMLPVAHLRRKKPYRTETFNIYLDYNQMKKRPMNAPKLIKPPTNIENKWNFAEIKVHLGDETDKMMGMINNIKQEVAGQIYYPDPIAHNPNLIQSIHLLAIHEQHHFNLVQKYEDMA